MRLTWGRRSRIWLRMKIVNRRKVKSRTVKMRKLERRKLKRGKLEMLKGGRWRREKC